MYVRSVRGGGRRVCVCVALFNKCNMRGMAFDVSTYEVCIYC